MGLPDPLRSRAVLVGPASYRHLHPLPAIAHNVDRLRALLTDEDLWGLPEAHCVALTDARATDDVEETLLAAARSASELLLFYFAGHGLLDLDSGRLFLALGEAEQAPIHRAIDYDRIRRAVLESRSASKVVILDCCYSGRATMGSFADQTAVEGTYLLTACDEQSLAVAPPGAEFTVFTGALLRLLADGVPGGPELLTTEDVYWPLHERLRAANHPLPVQRSAHRGHHIVLARNRAAPRPGVELPPVAAPTVVALAERPEWLSPAEVLGRLGDMRANGGHRAAEALLEAIGARRVPQEVVGVVDALEAAGAQADAGRLFAAVTGRPVGEVAEVVRVLGDLRRTAALRRLRRLIAAQDAAAVVEVADRLSPPERDALLDEAVEDRFGRPDAMIALVATLSTAPGMDGVLETLLMRTATRIPPPDAATLGDVLRDAGRTEAAFRVYEAAADVLARRPVAEVVALAQAMVAAERKEQARDVIGRALRECRTVGDYVAMLDALRGSAIPEAETDTVEAASGLPGDALLEFAHHLWRSGPDWAAGRLLSTVVATRPVTEAVGYLREFAAAGRPMDVLRAAQVAAKGDPGDIVGLLGHLGRIDPGAMAALADRLLDDPATAARVLVRLDPADPAATHLAAGMAASGTRTIVQVLRELADLGERPLARQLIATAAALRTPLEPTALRPKELDLGAHSSDHAAGLARRIIDLVAASPVQGARLARLTGANERACGVFAEHLVAEPPGVIAAVLTRAVASGADGHVAAALDRLARCDDPEVVRWVRRLWHLAPEPGGSRGRRPDLVDRYLALAVQYRRPAEVADLIGRLDREGATPMADRIIDALRADPGRGWARWHIWRLLGESPRTAALVADRPGDPVDPARSVAEGFLRNRVSQWEFTVEADESGLAGYTHEPALARLSIDFDTLRDLAGLAPGDAAQRVRDMVVSDLRSPSPPASPLAVPSPSSPAIDAMVTEVLDVVSAVRDAMREALTKPLGPAPA